MGSVESPTPPPHPSIHDDSSTNDLISPEEFTVLVTGFAPFRSQFPINPSWEITRALPPFLTIPDPTTSSSPSPNANPTANPDVNQNAHQRPTPSKPLKIRIITHPTPIRVSYATVRDLVPKLWDPSSGIGPKKIDFVLHIGMAAGRDFYSVERRGRRDGYRMLDVDGRACEDEWRQGRGGGGAAGGAGGGVEKGGRRRRKVTTKTTKMREGGENDSVVLMEEEEGEEDGDDSELDSEPEPYSLPVAHHFSTTSSADWIWAGCPPTLSTSANLEDVLPRWRASVPEGIEASDLQISEDAGRYLCDFIFYSSLAELYKTDQERRVVFLHVPARAREADLKRGVKIAEGLIAALVASWLVGERAGRKGRKRVGGKGLERMWRDSDEKEDIGEI